MSDSLTPEEKKQVVALALKFLHIEHLMCPAIWQALLHFGFIESYRDRRKVTDFIPELLAYKPEKPIGMIWFRCDAEGMQKRIDILTDILAKL